MSIAWTTILILALLLPGVLFYAGYATRDRVTREIVKSSAVGEVGAAVLVALILHFLSWGVLALGGFDLAMALKPFADYEHLPHWQLVDMVISRMPFMVIYVIITAISGFVLGCGLAWAIRNGWLPFLATHKWLAEVQRSMRRGLVTVYVMTTAIENNRVLMYKGVLSEFYLSPEGNFVYVVLKTCSRYYMKFEDDAPKTGQQLQLFRPGPGEAQQRLWDYLLIEGSNIANILFDPSPGIVTTNEGEEALLRALEQLWGQQDAPKPTRAATDALF